MLFFLSLLLLLSITANVILVWYTRKLVQNLHYAVNNVDEIQKLLNEYATLLEPLATMENYYGDPAITSTIANTKIVADACKKIKNSMLESKDEEIQKNQEDEESKDSQEQKASQTQAQTAP